MMGHGDAERMYDAMVLLGLDPVPWQFEVLAAWEQQAIDTQFAGLVGNVAFGAATRRSEP